jgi:hypothetical protein
MKKVLLSLVLIFSLNLAYSQVQPCSDLFISEYMEGSNNNKAMEFYNPTNADIALSGYTLGSNYNGTAFTAVTSFPAGAVVRAKSTYVLMLDKRDLAGTGTEYPIYDGFQVWDTCRTAAGAVIIDSITRLPVFCIQFTPPPANQPRRGTVYNDFLDLKCRATDFIHPVFNTSPRTMYYNGNDAMILFKGPADTIALTNAIDMVGVYSDPGMTTATGWNDWRGRSTTQDRTLVRKREIRQGTGLVAFARNDTFRYSDWLIYTHNSFLTPFQFLKSHTCDCDPQAPAPGRRTCAGVLIVGNQEVAQKAEFNIFPNPTSSNNINIEAEDEITEIRVMNIVGQVVDFQKLPIQGTNVQLTLKNVKTGMYFIEVKTSDNKTGVRKLIIN